MTGGTFESLKCAMRQSRDGVVISLVIHPSDVTAELMSLPIGARMAVKWATIEDEQASTLPVAPGTETAAPQSGEGTAAPPKPRRPFHELPLSQQCAIRCGDERFWDWLDAEYFHGIKITSAKTCAEAVRSILGISSRSELNCDGMDAQAWRNIEAAYQRHLATLQHAGTFR